MTLIKSISGIRGTIGGKAGNNLTPLDIVNFGAAYAEFTLSKMSSDEKAVVVIGRDARISGEMVSGLMTNTLISKGIDVIDLGLSTTPSVEMAVPYFKAQGGIIITASHNPIEWNALKLLNSQGEFLSGSDGEEIIALVNKGEFNFSEVLQLGNYKTHPGGFIQEHINEILKLPLVDIAAIKKRHPKIVLDPVNSTGALAIPKLLDAIGINDYEVINGEVNGHFSHNPEPLAENLIEISKKVAESGADLGIVVDPDVDRLAFICEDGSMFGEEYSLVAIADYILRHTKGNTVSNLSSSRALKDVTVKHSGEYFASAVGEVNVVKMMKEKKAVIGGEGNGGIIVPELHYGRDALAGLALFLSYYCYGDLKMTEIKKQLPGYHMSKNKIELQEGTDVDAVLKYVISLYPEEEVNLTDGVKIDLQDGWIHLRKSNTEPIIRIYTEAITADLASQLAMDLQVKVDKFLQ